MRETKETDTEISKKEWERRERIKGSGTRREITKS